MYVNPIAVRKTKVQNCIQFGLSECSRVKHGVCMCVWGGGGRASIIDQDEAADE